MRSFILKYVVSILLGAGFLWLAFHGEDWSDFGERLRTVDLGLLGLYVGLFVAGHVVRMARWGVLVRALGPVRWAEVMGAGAVGYMCIMVFPLRLGELVRPFLIRGHGGVSASGALATVVVERVIDGLMCVGFFFLFMSILPDTGDPAVRAIKIAGYVAGAAFLAILIVLIGGYLRHQQTVQLIERIGNRVHAGLTHKAVALLDAFLEGLKVLPDVNRITWFVLLTAIYWGLQGAGMTVMGHAVNIPDLTWTGGFALLMVLVVGIMVPGGPGLTGTFELALTAGFTLLALAPASRENVVLYTVMLHSIQLMIQVVVGVAFIASGRVRLRGVLRASDADPDVSAATEATD